MISVYFASFILSLLAGRAHLSLRLPHFMSDQDEIRNERPIIGMWFVYWFIWPYRLNFTNLKSYKQFMWIIEYLEKTSYEMLWQYLPTDTTATIFGFYLTPRIY